ncbi:MAG: alpha/beta fold hydrolase [Gammaproteobacteria bacterium]|nr:alpha/beta fold hydrolase [Gammaproteobacteria bacterium]
MEYTQLNLDNGVTLAAEIGGTEAQQCILLLHSEGQTHHEWMHLAQRLQRENYHVVSLDLRGHGDSDWTDNYSLDAMVDDVLAVLRTLPAKAAIVGSGIGAQIAVLAAGEEKLRSGKDLVEALVLVSPYPQDSAQRRHKLRQIAGAVSTSPTDNQQAQQAIADITATRLSPSTIHKYLRKTAASSWRWHADPALCESEIMASDLSALLPRITSAARAVSVPTTLIGSRANNPLFAAAREALPNIQFIAEETQRDLFNLNPVFDRFDQHALDAITQVLAPTRTAQVNTLALRRAFGAFATGVTVVTTTDANGKPVGLTANSFTSVSMEPPLLLFCLKNDSANLDTFRHSDCFAINILSHDQQDISRRFASKVEDRFALTPWETWSLNVPILQDTIASFECEKYAIYDGGDHQIFVGRIHQAFLNAQRQPLMYVKGGYHTPPVASA